ncbi:MAG: DUF4783 domain-containing protein [Bacteroidia bacterium]|nr:DUF4783 domain-containing protein [Bacteroidia bacterium]
MKLVITFFAVLASVFFSATDVSEDVVNALKQGKTSELVKYFDEKVSIKLINQEDVLSKSQAEANIKYFFEKHPVKNFSSSHISSPNNNSQYITGTLESGSEKFRVSILIRRNLVTQFRIETNND